MFWIIISIILACITILTMISNSKKDDEIAALKYTIITLSNDIDFDKAFSEYKRFKK